MRPIISVCRPLASFGKNLELFSKSSSKIFGSQNFVNNFATKSDDKNSPTGNSNSKNAEKVAKNENSSKVADKKGATRSNGMPSEAETSSTLKSSAGSAPSKSPTGSAPSKSGPTGTSSAKVPSSGASGSASPGKNVSGGGDKKIKSEDYKVQEYFQHDAFTFYDFEKNMVKNRMKQPSPSVKEGMAPAEVKK